MLNLEKRIKQKIYFCRSLFSNLRCIYYPSLKVYLLLARHLKVVDASVLLF